MLFAIIICYIIKILTCVKLIYIPANPQSTKTWRPTPNIFNAGAIFICGPLERFGALSRRPGDLMKNLETPRKTRRVGRYAYISHSNK